MKLRSRTAFFLSMLAALAMACGDSESDSGSVDDTGPAPAEDTVADTSPPPQDAPPADDGSEPDDLPAPDDTPPVPDDVPPSDVEEPDATDAFEPPDVTEAPDVTDDTGVDVEDPPDTAPPPCDCDDGNPCTVDGCDEDGACVFSEVPLPCEDGDPCTVGDTCGAGACQAGAFEATCDDGTPCTIDDCTPLVGCTTTPGNEGAVCDDGDACTLDESCAAGACLGAAVDCNDDDVCTDDLCDPSSGCYYDTETVCDDDNGCTIDSCDKDTGCKSEAVPDGTGCDDGDPCTGGDSCSAGVCLPGSEEPECDDSNECTTDSCVTGTGCEYAPVEDGQSCEDGNEFTVGDICKSGYCKGTLDDCAASLAYDDPTLKITDMFLLTQKPDALDIDGDGVKDNALGIVAPFINGPLQDAIDEGSLIYLTHLSGFDAGGEFPGFFFLGQLDPTTPTCNVNSAVCDYLVMKEGFDDSCNATSIFPSITWDGATLTSTEPGLFSLNFAFGGTLYEIAMHFAQLEIVMSLDGNAVDIFAGKVGGAVIKKDLQTLVSLIPELSSFAGLLDSLIVPDIDLDGDGVNEAISLAISIKGIGGNIVGMTE